MKPESQAGFNQASQRACKRIAIGAQNEFVTSDSTDSRIVEVGISASFSQLHEKFNALNPTIRGESLSRRRTDELL
jgi:hypothetical protein